MISISTKTRSIAVLALTMGAFALTVPAQAGLGGKAASEQASLGILTVGGFADAR
jgi:hypothetical protein